MKSFSWLFMRLRALRERENRLLEPQEDHRKENGSHGKQSTDHMGRDFPSFKVMCAAWGVDPGLVRGRLYMGWSLKNALTTPRAREVTVAPLPGQLVSPGH